MHLNYFRKHIFLFLNLIVSLVLICIPYYVFAGKLYVGGDDTKLLYIYPYLYLKNIGFYSWFNFSSVSSYNSPQVMLPFLFLWSILGLLLSSKVVLDYLSFSTPLLLGFIYFQALIKEIIRSNKNYRMEIFLGSLFYVSSPIIIVDQLSNFYNSVWLIGLIPIVFYYLIRYLKTSNFLYVFLNIIFCTIFSLGLFAVPWFLGFLFPLFISFLFLSFLFKGEKLHIKKISIYFSTLALSQMFWLLPIVCSYLIISKNSVGSSIFSGSFSNTFAGTVLSTASGNIIFPLLDLFHRQIAFDFGWSLKSVFINYYDKIVLLNLIFVIIIFVGIINVKKLLQTEKIIYFLILCSFLVSLFFFTVNVGPLENIFLLLGNVPGFVMFRNFYDKFALGYIIFYSFLITFSLVIVSRTYKKLKIYLYVIFFVVLLVNILPIKEIINKPLWTTKNIYTAVDLSPEYLNFLASLRSKVQPTSNILSLPFNDASYAIIKETDSNNAYVGTSPLKIFTGINDFSGDLSFNPLESQRINYDINNKNYSDLNKFVQEFNINYVLVTNNIPNAIKDSYLFAGKDLNKQGKTLIKGITDGKVLISKNGSYILYSAKQQTSLFVAKNIGYKFINPTMYEIYVKRLKGRESLIFNDAYNSGWKLYLNNPENTCSAQRVFNNINNIIECKGKEQLIAGDKLNYLMGKNIFGNSHESYGLYGNRWILDANYIKRNFNKNFYTVNKDGSINFELTLYFYPQLYFYIGSIISFITFACLIFYILRTKHEKIL